MLLEGLRSSLRILRHQPGLSALVVITLGLGIALSATLFSIFYGVILRPLPFVGGDRLMAVQESRGTPTGVDRQAVDAVDFVRWRENQKSFEGLAGYDMFYAFVTGEEGGTETHVTAAVTSGLFELLGVSPLIGRTFELSDESLAAPLVALIGQQVWQKQFNSDPRVLGKILQVNQRQFTIIGVMPEDFAFPHSQAVWTIRRLDPTVERGAMGRLSVVAKLAPGGSAAAAQAELTTHLLHTEGLSDEDRRALGVVVEPFTTTHTDQRLRDALPPMAVAVLAVLLIACINVANLYLARGQMRRRETAVAAALGASPRRLVARALVESTVLALLAGALGLFLTQGGIALFNRTLEPSGLFRAFWVDVRLEGAVVVFVLATSLITAILAGLIPALQASQARADEILREGSATSSQRIHRLGRLLVVAEIALSCGLLVASGLMIRTLWNLLAFDSGFRDTGVITGRVSIAPDESAEPRLFFENASRKLSSLPGVRRVAFTSAIPTQGSYWSHFETEDRPDADTSRARRLVVTPDFFDTFGVTPDIGRGFTSADTSDTPGIALVNRSFARLYFADTDPLGRRIRTVEEANEQSEEKQPTPWMTIVGVIPDLAMGSIDDGRSPAALYQPFAQEPDASMEMALLTEGDPAALISSICREIAEVNRLAACFNIEPMSEVLRRRRYVYDVFGVLLTVFGASALVLTTIGLFGVISVNTRNRTREYGLRLALGASPRRLLLQVLRGGLSLMASGAVFGLILAAALSRLLSSVLFGVHPWDPMVFVVVPLVMALCGLTATFIPALRTARLDPMKTLKEL